MDRTLTACLPAHYDELERRVSRHILFPDQKIEFCPRLRHVLGTLPRVYRFCGSVTKD
jgi:hypothetical protein